MINMPIKINPSNASDEELLSSFLPSLTVKEMVADYGEVRKAFVNSYPDELMKLRGIGPIKARQLTCLLEFSKRLYQASQDLPSFIRTPNDVVDCMADMRYLSHEEFRIVVLGTKNNILAKRTISQGILNATLVTPREVFHRAVKLMAAAMILVHNHPSGDPSPSTEDVELTKKMVEAGKIMGIAVLDHVIIGSSKHVSFKEKGLL
jgi:DNA repair protein RadC